MSFFHFSSCNWRYDLFVSFRGEDVRQTFLSHFLKELDRKLIRAFKDNKIKTGQSLNPILRQAIKDSRIAIVVFSENYASSAWCLNELLEIVECKKKKLDQFVIPVFYRLDPSHVRHQIGDFGRIFERKCHSHNKTEDKIGLWRNALTDVANLVGFHFQRWDNEAKEIENIVNDILKKLNSSPSKDFENFVGIKDHIAEMSLMLDLKSEEVRMVGIWGPSGIGKTTIARALFSRLSHHFQGRIFIDMRFVSTSIKDYSKDGIKVDDLDAVRGKLKHQKVLIIIDDLDDQVVLDALAGGKEWFGTGAESLQLQKISRF